MVHEARRKSPVLSVYLDTDQSNAVDLVQSTAAMRLNEVGGLEYFTSRFDYISCELLALRGGEHGRFHRANTVEEFS